MIVGPSRYQALWPQEMQGQRGLEPNDIVFGCMLDALVCNNQVDEAVKLFAPGQNQTMRYTIYINLQLYCIYMYILHYDTLLNTNHCNAIKCS